MKTSRNAAIAVVAGQIIWAFVFLVFIIPSLAPHVSLPLNPEDTRALLVVISLSLGTFLFLGIAEKNKSFHLRAFILNPFIVGTVNMIFILLAGILRGINVLPSIAFVVFSFALGFFILKERKIEQVPITTLSAFVQFFFTSIPLLSMLIFLNYI